MPMFKRCPKCAESLRLLSIKPTFQCKNCGAHLESNISKAELFAFLVYFTTLPFNWWLSEIVVECLTSAPAEYGVWRNSVFVLGLGLVIPIYAFVLQVRGSSNDQA